MALTPRLELRQGQTLVMTPQLQQAIKLLQLSNLDLQTYVAEELEKNPLLEDGGNRENDPPSEGEGSSDDRNDSVDLTDGPVDTDQQLANDTTSDAGGDLDSNYEKVYEGASSEPQTTKQEAPVPAGGDLGPFTNSGGGGGGNDFNLEAILSAELSLRDYLNEQLIEMISDPTWRLIGTDLIDSVNEAGYLEGSIEGVAERLGTEIEIVENVLQELQHCDPPGVLARNLTECLKIQLRELDRLDPAMEALVDNLEMLARHDFAGLVKICGVDLDDIRDMVGEIQALSPKPGLAFGGEAVQPVVPDVFVRESQEGGWQVELNSATLPRVLVNNHYYAEISKTTQKKEDKTYLTDCLNNANWLVKSLDQRARTILKVSSEIVKQQDGFLAHGVQHLRPLNLRTIAEAIEMHESTVSRVTSNKYIATSRGVFELKYFFTSAIASAEGGEAHSAESVRAKIKLLIDGEDPKKVLSDDKLVDQLKEDGVDIARRTVAKYREAMRIPSSVQRRRLKKMSA